MPGYVLALSGAIGAGKTSLAVQLSDSLRIDRVSFGQEVRRYAVETRQDAKDRAVLQKMGQALVLTDRSGFIARVLNQVSYQLPPNGNDRSLIIDGVRHIEVLLDLRTLLRPRPVHLIHIETPSREREKRLMSEKVDRRLVARYDNDITEAQVTRILPQYAAFKVDGELPVELQVRDVRRFIDDQIGVHADEPISA